MTIVVYTTVVCIFVKKTGKIMDRKTFLKNSLAAAALGVTGQATAQEENKGLTEPVGFNHLPSKTEKTMNTVLHKANTRGHANHGWLDTYQGIILIYLSFSLPFAVATATVATARATSRAAPDGSSPDRRAHPRRGRSPRRATRFRRPSAW